MSGPSNKKALATEVWRRWFDFFMRSRSQRDHLLARLGLTPNDARALSALNRGEGRTMQSLAAQWECDASNVTWIVDRLERLGLAERRSKTGDRRVKLVGLTRLGVKTAAELSSGVYRPPAELLALDRASLQALRDAMARLPSE
jgi:DNA-binding MarR family transcriptional regulator